MIEALTRVHLDNEVLLLLVGEGDAKALDQLLLPVHSLGYVQDNEILACAYAASDICVIPSIFENLPNMALEALSCGTPVVGFNHGGLSDVVLHGQTGLLALWKDVSDLAEQISYLLEHVEIRKRMGRSARKLMLQEHALEVEAARFVRLYQDIVQSPTNRMKK